MPPPLPPPSELINSIKGGDTNATAPPPLELIIGITFGSTLGSVLAPLRAALLDLFRPPLRDRVIINDHE